MQKQVIYNSNAFVDRVIHTSRIFKHIYICKEIFDDLSSVIFWLSQHFNCLVKKTVFFLCGISLNYTTKKFKIIAIISSFHKEEEKEELLVETYYAKAWPKVNISSEN